MVPIRGYPCADIHTGISMHTWISMHRYLSILGLQNTSIFFPRSKPNSYLKSRSAYYQVIQAWISMPAPCSFGREARPRLTLAPRGAATTTTNLHGKNHPRTQAHGPRGPANATTPHHPRTQAAWRKRRSLLAVLPPPPPPSTGKKPPKERQGRVHITLGLS